MSSQMRAANWAELAIPVIYNFFDIGVALRPALRPQIYNVMQSNRSKEENIGYGGISADAWANYENSGAKSMVDFDKGYTATYTHNEFVVQFGVERKLVDDDQYGVIPERGRKLGISAMQKMEGDAASVFNTAFTGTGGPDAKSLCSATHPRNPNKSGSLSNTGTAALTKANLAAARQSMMAFEDDAGNILGVMPNVLLVPPELEDTALELTNSLLDPASANNTINPQAGRFQVVTWHYLTDANNWFLIDSIWMKENLKWYERTPLEVTLVDESSTHATYDAYMRYSYGWDDWRWLFGNNVT